MALWAFIGPAQSLCGIFWFVLARPRRRPGPCGFWVCGTAERNHLGRAISRCNPPLAFHIAGVGRAIAPLVVSKETPVAARPDGALRALRIRLAAEQWQMSGVWCGHSRTAGG